MSSYNATPFLPRFMLPAVVETEQTLGRIPVVRTPGTAVNLSQVLPAICPTLCMPFGPLLYAKAEDPGVAEAPPSTSQPGGPRKQWSISRGS